jgi:acid phosphatase
MQQRYPPSTIQFGAPTNVREHCDMISIRWTVQAFAALLIVAGFSWPAVAADTASIARIKHIVVIYAENRSFDHLYGLFPGANGIDRALADYVAQVDHDGTPFTVLPPVWLDEHNLKNREIDPRYPVTLPNRPFRIDQPPISSPLDIRTRDLVHRFYQHKEQVNGGRNDRFVAMSNAGALVMGYYDGSQLPMWAIAREFTLADNFFMGAFGGSFLNHFWLVCACTPQYRNAPDEMRTIEDGNGRLARQNESPASAMEGPVLLKDGSVTPAGDVVNTLQPPYQPSAIAPAVNGDAALADPGNARRLPPQTMTTIGDTLSRKRISWAWYAGSWNRALADRSVIYNENSVNFQPHHQAFNYFANFAPGSAAREQHLRDGEAFMADIDSGRLPQVTFYKPTAKLNAHPGYTDVLSGDSHIADVIARIRNNPQLWKDVAIIVTYDENGGFWDHVAPPAGDYWGPGSRVPTIIVSPFARKGVVDHTLYDTTSILKFITLRFGLEPLRGVRRNAGDLTNAFE